MSLKFANLRPNAGVQKKTVTFADDDVVLETYASDEYDRSDDGAYKIRSRHAKWCIQQELNTFKRTEMVVHPDSAHNMRYYL